MRPEKKSRLFLARIRETIRKYNLLKKGDKVLVAFSGGADSSALLAILLDLQKEWNLKISLAHFNHGMRRSARRDEQFAVEMGHRFCLPLYLGREDVRAYALAKKLNVEEAGRTLRYEFLRRTAIKVGATKIATGHTLTDQAETFLLRLLRGSGRQGLGGIPPALLGERPIIRPLIEVKRDQVEAYLISKGLSYTTDETNFDRRFLRNRVRLELIPYLERHFAPNIVEQLGRLANIMREEDEFLEKAAKAMWARLVIEEKKRRELRAKSLASLPPALGRRCVRNFVSQIKGDLRRISFRDIEAIRKLDEGKEVQLPGKLVFRREGGRIRLKGKEVAVGDYRARWDGRGLVEIPKLELRFSGRRVARNKLLLLAFEDDRRAFLDWEKLRWPLDIRRRREGDRYRPLGAPGKKKLKELMRAKGIPSSLRDRHPVFLSAGKIVWVPGLPVAEEFKVDRSTKTVFVIEKL